MLFENDFISLTLDGNTITMHTKKNGFPIKSFDQVTQELPRLKINSFPELRKALSTEGNIGEIATYAPAININVSSDKMKADAEIYLTANELDESKNALPLRLKKLLADKGITSGLISIDWLRVRPRQTVLVAEGVPPTKGSDALLTYIKVPERRPVIHEDGLANYYEMNFVTAIEKEEWLGEKIPPQEGISGFDVFGNELPSRIGLDAKLYYDRKSVEEVEENGKIVLRALNGGVLEVNNGIVSVGQQLVINGDVGPETGSVTFDGTVVISGTVLAGYSVNATGDISVGAKEGVTNAKEIRSEQGDVYIQGGAFGGNATVIEAKGTIFIKHANDCCLYAHTIQVGLYLLGSDVIAEFVYVDRLKGRIIGGKIEALYRIECATAGNSHERDTVLNAKGIDKDSLHIDVQQMAQSIKDLQKQNIQLKSHIEPLEKIKDSLKNNQMNAYNKIQETLETNYQKVLLLDELIQKNLQTMKQAIHPQIEITNAVNPGVTIHIGKKRSLIDSRTKGTFELLDGILNI